ncbi:SMC6 protein, partial [Phaetusa simplex]|nr:SMC6 protein [Phaetusa simplex]
MGKRKEESISKPGPNKRQRQEYTDERSDESNEEETSQSSADNNFSLQSTAGEVGIIESIQLKNFMCHSMLGPFQFGSNLNFVVGNNGSGKSSVLTALIVGLGGKATATNRGSSLKMFVRDGETALYVALLWTYQYFSFLFLPLGAIISSKKEELIGILDHFNIQVDNPVSVLTQEMSKHFLQSKNEGDNFLHSQLNLSFSFFKRLKELKQLYSEKKHRYKSIGFVNDMRNHLEDLKHKMAWAVVGEMEKEIQPIKEGIRAEEGNTEKFAQKLEECQVKVNEAEEKYKAIQDKLITISEEAQALHPQCVSLKADVQAKRKAVNEAEVLYNRFKTEFKRLGKDDEQLRKRIEELKSSANQVSEPEKLERQRKIAHLREQLKAFHDEEAMIGQQVNQFQQAVSRCKEEHTRLMREDCDVKQALDAKQRQLRELKDSKTNTLKRFGPHVPTFLEAVETAYRQGRFKHKPVGPLVFQEKRSLVRSVYDTFADSVCNGQKKNLFVFLFTPLRRGEDPDGSVNRDCISYHWRVPGEALLAFNKLSVSHFKHYFLSWVGQSHCIFQSSRKAREVMQFNRPPKNCREAFTAEGDQVFERRYYSSDYLRPKFLSKDVEAEISHLEKEIENKKAQITASHQHLRSIESEIKQNENHLRGHRQHQKELQIKIRTTTAEIADLENMEEHQSVDICTLEDEAEENKGKMETVKKDMQQQSRKMEELKNILQVAEKKFEEMREKIHQVEEIAGPIKDELNQADSEVENSKRRLQHYEDKQKEHLACIKRHKDLLAAKEKELEEKIAQARQIYSERIEVSRTVKSLDAEMNRLRERINSENDRHGNREEIVQQFHDAKERYKAANSKVKNLKNFIMLLEEIMTQRFKIYSQFLRLLSLRCKLYFDNLLRIRACSGKILFDHKNETLSITVQPREEDKAALNDVRSLSGGERSFSTVCFILSLWSITESPFRCLDEFDVYMDMVNRRIAMDMILKVADSQHHRQFILLTPQSMSSLPLSSRIRILRMQDPERGQKTLNFQKRNDKEDDQ